MLPLILKRLGFDRRPQRAFVATLVERDRPDHLLLGRAAHHV